MNILNSDKGHFYILSYFDYFFYIYNYTKNSQHINFEKHLILLIYNILKII